MAQAGKFICISISVRTGNSSDDVVFCWSQFTSSLVDFGLVHFALTNLGLFIVGAEAEALLGTVPFLCVYGLSASAGGIASMASDASKLTVTSSDGLMVSLF